MGKPFFSGLGIVDMQNSLGSTTFSRNAYGTYTKTRIGAPAGSSFLTAWQVVMTGIQFDWANILVDSERTAWYKFSIRKKNNMAQIEWRNGYQAYMSVNLNLALLSLPPIYIPPVSYNAPHIPNLCSFSFINPFNVNVTRGLNIDFPAAVYISAPTSPGRMSLNQIFAFMGIINPPSNSGPFLVPFTARYGTPVTGRKIFGKCCNIDPATGVRSAYQYFSGIIS